MGVTSEWHRAQRHARWALDELRIAREQWIRAVEKARAAPEDEAAFQAVAKAKAAMMAADEYVYIAELFAR